MSDLILIVSKVHHAPCPLLDTKFLLLFSVIVTLFKMLICHCIFFCLYGSRQVPAYKGLD